MLDELIETIERLKKRIKEHRGEIQDNELRTRITLIDPMLQALGWDVSDPSLATIEPRTYKGWADYALLDNSGNTLVFVEAKKLSGRDAAIEQAVSYAVSEYIKNMAKVRYCAFTNGDLWELYDIFDGPKKVLQTSIVSDETAKCALQLLHLWRRSIVDGSNKAATQPVVSTQPPLDLVPTTPPPTSTPLAPPAGWIALNQDFEPVRSLPPKAMKFPDESERATTYWRDVLVQTAVWLHNTGRLTSKNCQIPSGGGQFILSRNGKHPDSRDFYRPFRVANEIILETRLTAISSISRSIRLLEHCGQDPSQVQLQLS